MSEPKTDWEEVRFACCAEAFHIDTATASARYLDLQQCYNGLGRHYHNWHHIRSCLLELDRVEVEGLVNHPYELEWAIYFHDSIYSAYYPADNEDLSAYKATRGLPKPYPGNIQALILSTDPKSGRPTLRDRQLIQDIDLSILGQEPKVYKDYAEKIAMEYAHVPLRLFIPARRDILLEFLARDRIYNTAFFGDLYEDQARENLKEETEDLENVTRNLSQSQG